ncbi:MAG TPA: outer membrane protein assembly factor BamE [Stellaceae bacterium]|nr:outer membrane protein assembly factor BamE [Stellaceae bacterium]
MPSARLYSVVAAIAALALFAACSTDLEQRGNLPDRDQLAQIHPGTTTKADVEKVLGSPSSTGVFDGDSWYYISKKTKRVAFFDPDVLDQEVYVVRFNDKGVVSGVDHKTLKDGREVTPVAGETPAPGRQLTFFEQLIGNIGKFNSGGS